MSAHRMIIDKPGVYEISAADYHADCCPAPSLSSSIARELLKASPAHAQHAHPRLNPDLEREEDEKFDIGTAAHAYLLEGASEFVIVDAPDWRTKIARELRDAAYAEGKTPLLAHRWQAVQDMAAAARRQLAAHQDLPVPFTAGKPEQTLIWREDGIWCRARLDWFHDTRTVIDDYKSTGATANPEAWCRTLFGMGYDVQSAFYCRGVKAVFGQEPTFRFVPQETYPPFALSVVALAPESLALAHKKVAHAIGLWRDCLSTGKFPGYPTRTCWAELPGWEETQWMAREARDEWERGVADDGRPLDKQFNRE